MIYSIEIGRISHGRAVSEQHYRVEANGIEEAIEKAMIELDNSDFAEEADTEDWQVIEASVEWVDEIVR